MNGKLIVIAEDTLSQKFLRVPVEELGDLSAELPAFEVAGRVRVRRDRLVAWIEEREHDYMRHNIASRVARTMAATETPLGILTAFVGAPVFIWLLATGRRGW